MLSIVRAHEHDPLRGITSNFVKDSIKRLKVLAFIVSIPASETHCSNSPWAKLSGAHSVLLRAPMGMHTIFKRLTLR